MTKRREEPVHRLTIRVPAALHRDLVRVAALDSCSVTDWIVKHVAQIGAGAKAVPQPRLKRELRLTVRVPLPVQERIVASSARANRTPADWLVVTLQKMVANRLAQIAGKTEQ